MYNTEYYNWNKNEMINRVWGVNYDEDHPYIKMLIDDDNKYLIGGDIMIKKDIYWDDGLDHYRLTPEHLKEEIKSKNSDCVVAFQTRKSSS